MSTPLHRRQHDDRTVWVVVAALFSVLIHLLLVLFVADWRLNPLPVMVQTARRLLSDKAPPMRVERLVDDPARVQERPIGAADEPSRGAVAVDKLAGALEQGRSRAEAETLTTPAPVPRERVSGLPVPSRAAQDTAPATWQPRQEIAAILDPVVTTELPEYPRREIVRLDRVPAAADIVPSVDLLGRGGEPTSLVPGRSGGAEVFDFQSFAGSRPAAAELRPPPELLPTVTEERFAVVPATRGAGALPGGNGSDAYVPIDDRLQVNLQIYRPPREPDRFYYRMAVQRRSDRDLPILPKDVVFVQDVSASLAEERLEFCRRGMIQAMAETLRAEDRFTVVAFRDQVTRAFDGWRTVDAASMAQARAFVSDLKSEGTTDLFLSLRELLALPRDPARPLIAVVVTDGRPTVGVIESTRIIGEFTRINDGAISVFAFGTQSRANVYLLDMLTYCNRGAARVLKGNRWDIPDAMVPVFNSVRHPVMSAIDFAFDTASRSEVYPKLTTNLYADRPLELFGLCPAGTREIACQIRGRAGATAYDVVFRLDVEKQSFPGEAIIRDRWADQKMYHLIGAYARDPQPEIFEQMRSHGATFDLLVPYRTELGR